MVQLPPGLTYDGSLDKTAEGGADAPWLPYEKVKMYTNAFVIVNDSKVRASSANVAHSHSL